LSLRKAAQAAAPLEDVASSAEDDASLNGSFGLDQFVCARSAEQVVWRAGPWARRPAALLYILALFPVRRDLLQRHQVFFRIASLQEFRHTDRRERRNDGVLGVFGRYRWRAGAARERTKISVLSRFSGNSPAGECLLAPVNLMPPRSKRKASRELIRSGAAFFLETSGDAPCEAHRIAKIARSRLKIRL
jgi:hypothetical protein